MRFNPRGNGAAHSSLSSYKILRRGDIAFEGNRHRVHPFGQLVINDISDGLMSSRFQSIRPKAPCVIPFWKYLLQNERGMRHLLIRSTKSGTLMNEFVFDDFSRQSIPLPEEREQEKIGTLFKLLDSIIAAEKRKLDLLQKKKTALLLRVFGQKLRFKGYDNPWNRHKLGSITDSYSGGTPPVRDSSYYGGDIPFIRSAEIANESTELFITQSGLAASSAKWVKKGDVLYALYGANSGNTSFAKLDGVINQAVLSIRAKKGFSNSFIMYWLQRSKNAIIGTFLQGGQGNLSGSIVKKLSIQTPRIDEQERIGLFFIKIDSRITAETRKLDLLIDKKKALLQKMFV